MTAEEFALQVREELNDAWLPQIYRERIRKLRTRAYSFEGLSDKSRVEIQHTLLGVELKAGKRRLLCPDLATARYLSVFARIGSGNVAVPYDITQISRLADELESSWQRAQLLAQHTASGKSDAFVNRVRRILTKWMREEVAEAGAGAPVPEFKQTTKQRN